MKIYKEHQGWYGYRHIKDELCNRGYIINHKKVIRLMRELEIKGKHKSRKFQAFNGEINNKVDNVIDRNFKTDEPLTKFATDVTQLNFLWVKYYLSAIIDMYNGEVVSYTLSPCPTLDLVMDTTL